MEEATRVASRRSLLGRGALLVAGALGVTAAQRSNAAHAAVPLPTKGAAKAMELSLYARNFHLQAPTHRAGQLPVGGDSHSAYGELLDRPNGKVIGHFTAAQLTQDSPFAAAVSSLEIHTFHLEDGTIHGLGTALRGTAGSFTILGGTGRYAGVSGSYVATQRQREHGGNGTADFHLKLAA
jgi:hypothetical protein